MVTLLLARETAINLGNKVKKIEAIATIFYIIIIFLIVCDIFLLGKLKYVTGNVVHEVLATLKTLSFDLCIYFNILLKVVTYYSHYTEKQKPTSNQSLTIFIA